MVRSLKQFIVKQSLGGKMKATCEGRESGVSGFPPYSPNTVEEAPHSVGSQTCVEKNELNN